MSFVILRRTARRRAAVSPLRSRYTVGCPAPDRVVEIILAVPKELLIRDLDRLRAELAASHELDAATRESLATLAEDIERILGQDQEAEQSLLDRARAAALQFEAEHPRLARALSEITDTLAKLGI